MTGTADGKVAVVTGGASGIGRGIALRLARDGARVAVFDLNGTEAKSVVEEIRSAGGSAHAVAAGWGRIVNIASSSAHSGQPLMTHYVASKAGVLGFTKALALELGPKGTTVNTIPPGFIDTPMTRRNEAQGFLGAGVDHHAAQTPVRRAGLPEDIAAACAFLVSEEAGYITGRVIGVNGGRNT